MAIDLSYEQSYYADAALRAARIAQVFHHPQVRDALSWVPDADSVTANVRAQEVLISAHVHLNDEPAIVEVADLCDGERYRLQAEQELLYLPDLARVVAQISGSCKLADEERALLRRIGKLRTETREYLACGV